MRKRVIILSMAVACAGLAQAQVATDIAKCQGCHMAQGPDAAPRLNGQSSDYIEQRLREFHDPTSQSPHAVYSMWDMATALGAADARAAALYFSALPATPAWPGGRQSKAGARLYVEKGCQSCHGDGGVGLPGAPRLAGQRPSYLSQQLAAFSLAARYHPQMLGSTSALSRDQMDAIAAWLGNEKGP